MDAGYLKIQLQPPTLPFRKLYLTAESIDSIITFGFILASWEYQMSNGLEAN
jgi:hypothetical protein